MPDKLIVTFQDRPRLDGFTIRIPAGTVIRSQAEAMDLLMFEYQWQCDEAPTVTLEFPLKKNSDPRA
jgi:hypothetical protein